MSDQTPTERQELERLLTLSHEAIHDLAHDVSAQRLYVDAARVAERHLPGPVGEAVAAVLALEAYAWRNRPNGCLGASTTTLALALAVLSAPLGSA